MSLAMSRMMSTAAVRDAAFMDSSAAMSRAAREPRAARVFPSATAAARMSAENNTLSRTADAATGLVSRVRSSTTPRVSAGMSSNHASKAFDVAASASTSANNPARGGVFMGDALPNKPSAPSTSYNSRFGHGTPVYMAPMMRPSARKSRSCAPLNDGSSIVIIVDDGGAFVVIGRGTLPPLTLRFGCGDANRHTRPLAHNALASTARTMTFLASTAARPRVA